MPQTSLFNYFPKLSSGAFSVAGSASIMHDPESRLSKHQTGSHGSTSSQNKSEILSTSSSLVRHASEGSVHLVQTTIHGSFRASIAQVNAEHLQNLKSLTTALLPVKYPDGFFLDAVHDTVTSKLCRTVLVDGKPVGWIRCRLEVDDDTGPHRQSSTSHPKVYIQALCLSPPYQGLGLATALLNSVCSTAMLPEFGAQSISAHVWECNSNALEWYEKRGFKRIFMMQTYYRKLRPAGAWLMHKELT